MKYQPFFPKASFRMTFGRLPVAAIYFMEDVVLEWSWKILYLGGSKRREHVNLPRVDVDASLLQWGEYVEAVRSIDSHA